MWFCEHDLGIDGLRTGVFIKVAKSPDAREMKKNRIRMASHSNQTWLEFFLHHKLQLEQWFAQRVAEWQSQSGQWSGMKKISFVVSFFDGHITFEWKGFSTHSPCNVFFFCCSSVCLAFFCKWLIHWKRPFTIFCRNFHYSLCLSHSDHSFVFCSQTFSQSFFHCNFFPIPCRSAADFEKWLVLINTYSMHTLSQSLVHATRLNAALIIWSEKGPRFVDVFHLICISLCLLTALSSWNNVDEWFRNT